MAYACNFLDLYDYIDFANMSLFDLKVNWMSPQPCCPCIMKTHNSHIELQVPNPSTYVKLTESSNPQCCTIEDIVAVLAVHKEKGAAHHRILTSIFS